LVESSCKVETLRLSFDVESSPKEERAVLLDNEVILLMVVVGIVVEVARRSQSCCRSRRKRIRISIEGIEDFQCCARCYRLVVVVEELKVVGFSDLDG
jgi:hypothetical protein